VALLSVNTMGRRHDGTTIITVHTIIVQKTDFHTEMSTTTMIASKVMMRCLVALRALSCVRCLVCHLY